MPYMRRSLNINTCYLDKFSGAKVPVFCSSYLLNIVFPSVSRSVPYKLRKHLRDFFMYYYEYQAYVGVDNQFTPLAYELYNKFKDLIFIPLSPRLLHCYSQSQLISFIYDEYDVLKPFLDVDFDIKFLKSLANKRVLFISKLFQNIGVKDIATKEYVVKKKFKRRFATEML